MSDPRVKALARDVTKAILDHWVTYKEPYALSILASHKEGRLKRAMGFDITMAWFCETLDKAGILHIITAKSSKRWIFLKDVWNAFNEADKAKWLEWTRTAIDPRTELLNYRKALKSSTAPIKPKETEHKD